VLMRVNSSAPTIRTDKKPFLNPSSPVCTLNAQLRKRAPFALNLRTFYSESEREGRLQSAERAVPTQFANDTTNLLSA
jgi:hypothetical protein